MFRLVVLSFGLLFGAGAMSLAAPSPAPPKVPKELLEQRVKAAKRTYERRLTRIRLAEGMPADLFGWSRRWLDAELALSKDKAARLASLQAHVKRTREVEGIADVYAKAGQGQQDHADEATYYRIEAEIMLIEAGGQLPKQDKPTAPKVEKLGTPQKDK